jgi:hypothetical protein
VRFYGYKATNWGTTDYDKKIALERKNNQVFIGGLKNRYNYIVRKVRNSLLGKEVFVWN